jgi:cyclophilin family peptidyl-prolyl cis-trans isomerase
VSHISLFHYHISSIIYRKDFFMQRSRFNAGFASILALTLCCTFAATTMFAQSKSKSKEKTSKSTTIKTTKEPSKMATPDPNRPQYSITVTHGGRPLGSFTVEIYKDLAPKHAANFDSLVSVKFYDGTAFHRIIPGFMLQGGDPNSRPTSGKAKQFWGMGEPGQRTVPAEFSQTLHHEPGVLSAARTMDPNSATSQFFVCHGLAPHLDGQYSIFGRVVSGMEIVDQIARIPCEAGGDGAVSSPLEKVEMTIAKK